MKRLLLLFTIITSIAFAQPPEGIQYTGLAISNSSPIANYSSLPVLISI